MLMLCMKEDVKTFWQCVLNPQIYLDGLSKAALSQHLSMDQVRGAEDAVSTIWHDSERLWSIDVLPLGDGGRCVAGAWWLINAVAPPGEWEVRKWENRSIEDLIITCCRYKQKPWADPYWRTAQCIRGGYVTEIFKWDKLNVKKYIFGNQKQK